MSEESKAQVERLQEIYDGDHARLCQGREYSCTCGFDTRAWATAREAADLITLQATTIADQAMEIERLTRERDEARDRHDYYCALLSELGERG